MTGKTLLRNPAWNAGTIAQFTVQLIGLFMVHNEKTNCKDTNLLNAPRRDQRETQYRAKQPMECQHQFLCRDVANMKLAKFRSLTERARIYFNTWKQRGCETCEWSVYRLGPVWKHLPWPFKCSNISHWMGGCQDCQFKILGQWSFQVDMCGSEQDISGQMVSVKVIFFKSVSRNASGRAPLSAQLWRKGTQ